jgi:PII-like signaling protein
MVRKIRSHSLGKLEIYLEPAHKVRLGQRTLFRKLFPRSAYLHIISEAKKDGIIKASVHAAHASYGGQEDLRTFTVDGDNARLSMCVELIDRKEKLEHFFLKHQELLRSKVVIYKEVEFWDAE